LEKVWEALSNAAIEWKIDDDGPKRYVKIERSKLSTANE